MVKIKHDLLRGKRAGDKTISTDSSGNIILENKNNHTHSYVPTGNVKNDLTTGGASNVLSAEQGKTLNTNKLAKNADDTSTGYITAKGFKVTGAASGTFVKADGSTAAANNYSHPTNYTTYSSDLYKITVNNNGHVSAASKVTIDSTPANNASNLVSSQGVYNALAGKAPTSHTNTGNTATYGQAKSDTWGHVKVSDNYTSSAGNAAGGIAASSAAVKSVYDEFSSSSKTTKNGHNHSGTYAPASETAKLTKANLVSGLDVYYNNYIVHLVVNWKQNQAVTANAWQVMYSDIYNGTVLANMKPPVPVTTWNNGTAVVRIQLDPTDGLRLYSASAFASGTTFKGILTWPRV